MKFGHFFAPMLLDEIEKPFDSEDYLFELKFDGVRATLHVGPKTFKIFGRRGNEITNLYPELKQIQKYFKENIIFDGEIVVFQDGLPNFSKLQERSHTKDALKIKRFSEEMPVCFIVFDCLYYKGKDITNKTLLERKKVLNEFEDNDFFIKVSYVLKEGKELFNKVKKVDFEGIVAKKIDSVYEVGTRSENWIKIKNLKKETFYIGGYIDKPENAVVSLLLGEYKNNKLHFVGKVSMGKKQNMYQKLKKEKQKIKTPFCDYEDKECIYIEPKLKCEIAYLERTKTNHLRQPVFKK